MAVITKMVDERIELIRKEKAELDLLKRQLDEREATVRVQEESWATGNITYLEEEKDRLNQELTDITEEVTRLRSERNQYLTKFGSEIDSIHSEKATECKAQVAQLEKEIALLRTQKDDISQKIQSSAKELSQMLKKKEEEEARIQNEKEQYLQRQREEKESSLKEINSQYAIGITALEQKKNELEKEISSLEQQKRLSLEKAEAEMLRYKNTKIAEADTKKEQILAKAVEDGKLLLDEFKERKNKALEELEEHESQKTRNLNELILKRQAVADEIELLQYEYEQRKAENIVKFEKERITEQRMLEDLRKQTLGNLEKEKEEILSETEQRKNGLLLSMQEERVNHERELAQYKVQKSSLQTEIQLLNNKFHTLKLENEAALETLKGEKLKEVDEIRIQRIQEIEDMRSIRMADLESAYFEKIDSLESARNEKIEERRKYLEMINKELEELKDERKAVLAETESLKSDIEKIKKSHEEELERIQQEAQLEQERIRLQTSREIEASKAEADRIKSEKAVELHQMRNEKIKEMEELRLKTFEEMEYYHKQKIGEMERNHAQKMESLEAARQEKIELIRKAIDDTELELENLKLNRQELRIEIDALTAEVNKIKLENEALTNREILNRKVELEKLETKKIKEIDGICDEKLKIVEQQEESAKARINELEAEIKVLQVQKEFAGAEASNLKNQYLSEIEQLKIENTDTISKIKLLKMKEIEQYLDAYRAERLAQVQKETDRQIENGYKSIEELAQLNKEYESRMSNLNELALSIESEKRSISLKEKLITEEQNDYKNLIQNEMEFHRKEMALLMETKDHQIALMQNKIQSYIKELEEHRAESTSNQFQ